MLVMSATYSLELLPCNTLPTINVCVCLYPDCVMPPSPRGEVYLFQTCPICYVRSLLFNTVSEYTELWLRVNRTRSHIPSAPSPSFPGSLGTPPFNVLTCKFFALDFQIPPLFRYIKNRENLSSRRPQSLSGQLRHSVPRMILCFSLFALAPRPPRFPWWPKIYITTPLVSMKIY